MKRLVRVLAAGAIVCALAWLFGFDFSERGFATGMLALISCYAMLGAYFIRWEDL